MPKAEKREVIARELAKIEVTPDIYMPTNPRFQITAVKIDSGCPMQSAAKCPILVSFYCRKYEGPDRYFERKLRFKREVMEKLAEELEILQPALSPSPNWDFADMSDEEEKAPIFINELVRPIKRASSRQVSNSGTSRRSET